MPGEKNVLIKNNFDVGEQIKIKEGPFTGFSGSVENVDAPKNKLDV